MPRARPHANLRLTADIVILTIRPDSADGVNRLHLLLVERAKEPFRGALALPGGFVSEGEDLGDAALRELREETGINGSRLHLEQVRTYGAPDRDPRGRVVTVAYLGIAPDLPDPRAASDARSAAWCTVDDVLGGGVPLAFDHDVIVSDAVERARSKLEYTSLATAFCTEPFTIGDLRAVYDTVWGTSLDPGNFSRKVTRTEGFIVALGRTRVGDLGRPPALYRRGEAANLYPPILRNSLDR